MPKTDIATLLAVASALCVAIGDVLQQRAAHRIKDRSVSHTQLFASLLRNQRWRWGVVLLAGSIALQAAALRWGSVLLVQALLMLSLLFALPINARLSNRTVTGGEWVWASLLTVAVVVVVVAGNPQAGRSSASLGTWTAVAVALGPPLGACVVAGRKWGGAPAAVLFAFVSGSLWGVFAVLSKVVVAQLGEGGSAVARSPEVYAWLLVAAGGFVWGQAAFRAGPLTASMPTLEISQPVIAAVLGVAVLDETLDASPLRTVALVMSALVMAVAIYRLARVDAVATRGRVRAELRGPARQPA